MEALVLGGSRFVGLRLVELLHHRGHRVTVLNRGISQETLPDDVLRLRADRSDPKTIASVLRGKEYDVAFDISGYTPSEVLPVRDALAGRVGHYIFCSTVAVYARGDVAPIWENHPLNHSAEDGSYAKEKIRCEELVLEAHTVRGLPVSVIRPPIVYGPHNHGVDREASFFARLTRGRPVMVPGGALTMIHMVHVDDLASAFVSAAGSSRAFSQVYNVSGPEAITLKGYVRTVGEVMGVTPEIVHIQSADLLEEIVSSAQGVFPFGWAESSIYSDEKIRRDLDWHPRFTLQDGLAMTYRWWLDQGLDKQEWDFSLEDRLLEKAQC